MVSISSFSPSRGLHVDIIQVQSWSSDSMRCEVNRAVDADDDEADDDGGHGHPERVATQPLGAFYVPLVVTVQSLQRANRESQLCPSNTNLLAKQHDSSEPTEQINVRCQGKQGVQFSVPLIFCWNVGGHKTDHGLWTWLR